MTGNLTDPLKSFCPHDPPGGWAAAQREAVTLSGHLGLVSGGATLSSFFFFCLFVFLGPHPRHVEVPRLGV